MGKRTVQATHVLAIACISACGSQPDHADGRSAVRDSAGIVVVENRAPASGPRHLAEPIITLREDRPIEEQPLDPTAVFSDDAGRILVGDGNQAGWHAVLVHDSTGAFIMKIGGPGRGPGEFGGQLWWAGAYRGDSIAAWDRRGPSMKIYGPDGGYARDVPIPPIHRVPPPGTYGFSVGFHGALDDGTLLASSGGILDLPSGEGPAWYRHLLLAVEPAGMRWDTLGEYGMSQAYWDGSAQSPYLFGPSGFFVPYGDDLIRGNAASWEYRVIARYGRDRRIVRKMHTPQLVEPADVEDVVQLFLQSARSRSASDAELTDLRRLVEAYPRAAEKPAYSNILVADGGHVWVERYRWVDPWTIPPEPVPTTWDVFSPTGEWLTEITVPAGIVLLSVSHGRIHGMRIDALDVRHVVIFERPPL